MDNIIRQGFLVTPLSSKLQECLQNVTKLSNEYFLAQEKTKKPTNDQARLGIGYNYIKNLKECIQIRFGGKMEYPDVCSKEFVTATQKLYSLFDLEVRNVLKTIFADTDKDLYERLISSLDPICSEMEKDDTHISSSVLDICHYFKDSKTLFCNNHTDQGLLTISVEMDRTALQIYLPREKSNWTFCQEESTSGHVDQGIVMTGEQMAIFSKRSIKPTIHRVKNLEYDRTSIIFKLRARPDVLGPMTDSDYSILQIQIPPKKELSRIKSLRMIQTHFDNVFAPDILRSICYFLSVNYILNTSIVCKDWYEAINDNSLWRFLSISHFHVIAMNIVDWKTLYIKRYLASQSNKPQKFEFVEGSKSVNSLSNIKAVIVGDGGTGKTSTLIVYATGKFPSEYVPTVFDEYSCNVQVGDHFVCLGLWDTAGQPEYDRLRPLSYPETNIFFVTYSVTERSSFDNVIGKWIAEIHLHNSKTPWILVGNKIDARPDAMLNGIPVVTSEEGLELAKKEGSIGFFEISAVDNAGIADLFKFACSVCVSSGIIFKKTPKKDGQKDKCNLQ
jgi:small GTP-binding protein